MHYKRAWKSGSWDPEFCYRNDPSWGIEELIVNRTVGHEDPAGCWEWQRWLNGGYGRLMWEGRKWLAHRLVYHLYFEPVTPDMLVRHRCDNRSCINPHHLESGTPADNMRDRLERGGYEGMPRGEASGRSVLTEDAVVDARWGRIVDGESYASLGRKHGVAAGTIRMCVVGGNWAHVPFPQCDVATRQESRTRGEILRWNNED